MSRFSCERMFELAAPLAALLAAIAALLYANSWAGSHDQFTFGDLFLLMLLVFLLAFVTIALAILAAAWLIGLLLLGSFALAAHLSGILARPVHRFWHAMRRLPAASYESVRAVVVTAVNVLLYPRCTYCDHHHESAITGKPVTGAPGPGSRLTG